MRILCCTERTLTFIENALKQREYDVTYSKWHHLKIRKVSENIKIIQNVKRNDILFKWYAVCCPYHIYVAEQAVMLQRYLKVVFPYLLSMGLHLEAKSAIKLKFKSIICKCLKTFWTPLVILRHLSIVHPIYDFLYGIWYQMWGNAT